MVSLVNIFVGVLCLSTGFTSGGVLSGEMSATLPSVVDNPLTVVENLTGITHGNLTGITHLNLTDAIQGNLDVTPGNASEIADLLTTIPVRLTIDPASTSLLKTTNPNNSTSESTRPTGPVTESLRPPPTENPNTDLLNPVFPFDSPNTTEAGKPSRHTTVDDITTESNKSDKGYFGVIMVILTKVKDSFLDAMPSIKLDSPIVLTASPSELGISVDKDGLIQQSDVSKAVDHVSEYLESHLPYLSQVATPMVYPLDESKLEAGNFTGGDDGLGNGVEFGEDTDEDVSEGEGSEEGSNEDGIEEGSDEVGIEEDGIEEGSDADGIDGAAEEGNDDTGDADSDDSDYGNDDGSDDDADADYDEDADAGDDTNADAEDNVSGANSTNSTTNRPSDSDVSNVLDGIDLGDLEGDGNDTSGGPTVVDDPTDISGGASANGTTTINGTIAVNGTNVDQFDYPEGFNSIKGISSSKPSQGNSTTDLFKK